MITCDHRSLVSICAIQEMCLWLCWESFTRSIWRTENNSQHTLSFIRFFNVRSPPSCVSVFVAPHSAPFCGNCIECTYVACLHEGTVWNVGRIQLTELEQDCLTQSVCYVSRTFFNVWLRPLLFSS